MHTSKIHKGEVPVTCPAWTGIGRSPNYIVYSRLDGDLRSTSPYTTFSCPCGFQVSLFATPAKRAFDVLQYNTEITDTSSEFGIKVEQTGEYTCFHL